MTITVKELMKELKRHPEDVQVFIQREGRESDFRGIVGVGDMTWEDNTGRMRYTVLITVEPHRRRAIPT